MIQNLHFEKVSIWLQIDRNPYMVADNRELPVSSDVTGHLSTILQSQSAATSVFRLLKFKFIL
mgnify:CR=1 FL=1